MAWATHLDVRGAHVYLEYMPDGRGGRGREDLIELGTHGSVLHAHSAEHLIQIQASTAPDPREGELTCYMHYP